jgi:hypothetical protein
MAKYQPGVCNIGKNERNKRYAIATGGIIITAIVVYLVLLLGWPHWALVISLIPLLIGFEGFWQGYFSFCAGFAAKGISDLSGSGGSLQKVTDAASHKKDMDKAKQIHLYAIISAVIIFAIIYLLV